jgi:exodeoxyribonuclease VII large subunit
MLAQTDARLHRAMRARIEGKKARLGALERRIGDPRLAIASFQQTLDDRTGRLRAEGRRLLNRRRDTVADGRHRLALLHPSARIAREQTALHRVEDRLSAVMRRRLTGRATVLGGLVSTLDAMSPLRVLRRGYAIATRSDGRAVREASDVRPGERIDVRVLHARLTADVVRADEDEREPPS